MSFNRISKNRFFQFTLISGIISIILFSKYNKNDSSGLPQFRNPASGSYSTKKNMLSTSDQNSVLSTSTQSFSITSPTRELIDETTLTFFARLISEYIYRGCSEEFKQIDASYCPPMVTIGVENGGKLDVPGLTVTEFPTARHTGQATIDVLRNNVAGNFVETGVWRGGSVLLMAILLELNAEPLSRKVYAFDSFGGLPPQDQRKETELEKHSTLDWTPGSYAATQNDFEENMRRVGILRRVVPVVGWFDQTINEAKAKEIGPIAILRLDGDLYESTIIPLTYFYANVEPGGIIIIDDYGITFGPQYKWNDPALTPCARAVEKFRMEHEIADEMYHFGQVAYWIKML